jgi:hypothetical protein
MSVGKYRALSDSFREFNRMILEGQQFDAQQESTRLSLGIKRLIAEQQAEGMFLDNQIKQEQAAKAQARLTPNPVTLTELLQDPAMANNPLFMEDLTRGVDIGGLGVTYSPADREFKLPSGDPYMLSDIEKEKLLPIISGVFLRHFDPVTKNNQAKFAIDTQISQLQKVLKGTGDHPHAQRNRGQAKVALNRARAQRLQLDAGSTDIAYKEHYRQRQQLFNQLEKYAVSIGDDDQAAAFARDSAAAAKLEGQYAIAVAKAAGTKKGGQPVMKLAMQIKDGRVVPGSVVQVPVPKNGAAGLTPGMIDPTLKEHIWQQGSETLLLSTDDVTTYSKYITGQLNPKLDEAGQFVIEEHMLGRTQHAQQMFAARVKAHKGTPGPTDMLMYANNAIHSAKKAFSAFEGLSLSIYNSETATPDQLEELFITAKQIGMDAGDEGWENISIDQFLSGLRASEDVQADLEQALALWFEERNGYNPLD